jgi:signal transduction histidine kinase
MTETRPRILLVDDTEANLVALEAQLGDLDCEILLASNGNAALRVLLRHPFAVMLLDVQMPEMDGYEVARYARENPQTRDVPIIFVTAMHETEANRFRGYGAGAVDLLFKPVDPYVLRSKVQVFLALYRERWRLAAEVAAHRETSAALRAANRELVATSTAKSDFLAMMSHELRTPLNAIIGFSELIVDERAGPLNGKQLGFMRNVRTSATHLLTLINDLLDLSKIEAGRLEMGIQRCAPRELAADAIGTVQQLASAKSILLSLDAPTDPPAILADPVRAKQVLYNLLSNAIKFTPTGGSVTVSFARSEDGRLLRTSVRDTGPGISSEDLARLFQPFTQLVNAHQAPRSGTGLGLSLTRRLVELMGGSAGVESELNKGSHFFFDLPIGAQAPDDDGVQ